jgi:riboflavin-specific deaminase-like protein
MTRTDEARWQTVLGWLAEPATADAAMLRSLYEPLCRPGRDGYVVAHLAQSLDGRIATHAGSSQWLSGAEDLLHTHRMRALFDAVIVGADTVLHDDPQLTVRRCAGSNPVRVVIDPQRRLDGSQRMFCDGAARTLVLVDEAAPSRDASIGRAEVLRLPSVAGTLAPQAIRRALAEHGLARLFIEGGGVTVSRFLAARALHRLQLTVAPVVLGSGRPSLTLPQIAHLRDGLRPRTRRFTFGGDVMFECDFDA